MTLIREKVISTIEKLERGSIKKEEAMAVATLCQTFINSVKVEVEAAKLIDKMPTKVFQTPELTEAILFKVGDRVYCTTSKESGKIVVPGKLSSKVNFSGIEKEIDNELLEQL